MGVVTAVSILCPPRPSAVHVSYLAVPDFATIQKARPVWRTYMTLTFLFQHRTRVVASTIATCTSQVL